MTLVSDPISALGRCGLPRTRQWIVHVLEIMRTSGVPRGLTLAIEPLSGVGGIYQLSQGYGGYYHIATVSRAEN